MTQNFQLGLLGQAVTVNATTNAVSVNSSVNATSFTIGTSWIANATSVTIANTGSMLIGNTTVNTYVVPASISINGTTWVANTTGAYHTGTINATSFTTTGVTSNATGVYLANTASLVVGNATVNTVISQGVINTTSVVNAASYTIGTTLIGNTTGIYHTGTINAASFTTTGVTANVTGVFLANTAQFYAGNSTINTSITSYSATFGTNTVTVGTGTYFVSNGNVGIGTSSPGVKLDVTGSIRASQYVTIGNGGGTYQAGSIYSDANWGMLFRAAQTTPLAAQFRWSSSADSEYMRIDTSGNVGIGNTAPNAKLQVTGTANISGVTTFGANVTGPGTTTNLDGFLIDCGVYS